MSETHVNFMGGSPLNRLSWLRTSHAFLNALVDTPSTRWVAFQDGKPLVSSLAKNNRLALLTTADVEPLLGSKPYFGQGEKEDESAVGGLPILEAARFRGAPVVFLGLNETQVNDFSPALPHEQLAKTLSGTSYFSIDVTNASQTEIDRLLHVSSPAANGPVVSFSEPRGATSGMDQFDAAVFAVARSLVDWNFRNKFCASCGSPVHSLWGGWKLSCTSLLPWTDNTGRKPCPTEKGLHNIAHPRSDPVVIMAVLNEAQDKILLGRNKKFPGKFYSALAGFVEPGESFEDAVRRELWEEAGVHVWDVKYHSGQPWPYPANLMVGYYATGDPSKLVRTDLDNELEDARWFTREEVRAVLEHKEGTNFTKNDYPDAKTPEGNPLAGDAAIRDSQIREAPASVTAGAAGGGGPPFRVPPRTAIAGVLISDWAYEKAHVLLKGRM